MNVRTYQEFLLVFQATITKKLVKIEDDLLELLTRTSANIRTDLTRIRISLPVETVEEYHNLIGYLDDDHNFNNLVRG